MKLRVAANIAASTAFVLAVAVPTHALRLTGVQRVDSILSSFLEVPTSSIGDEQLSDAEQTRLEIRKARKEVSCSVDNSNDLWPTQRCFCPGCRCTPEIPRLADNNHHNDADNITGQARRIACSEIR